MREHEEEKAGDGHVGDKPTLACYAHSPSPPHPPLSAPPLSPPPPHALTQHLQAWPSVHLSASILAPMLMSDTDLLGRSISTIWITRPSCRCASKQVFHSGYRVRFRCTSWVPRPAQQGGFHVTTGGFYVTTGWISRHKRVAFTSRVVRLCQCVSVRACV